MSTDFFSGIQNTEEQHHRISEKILTLNVHFYIQPNYQSSIRAKKILFKLFNDSKFTTHKSFLEELQEHALQQNKTK